MKPDLTRAILSKARQVCGDDGGRLIVGIAGPPGAGKSTLVEKLHAELQAQGDGEETSFRCAIVPMDGFHLDNSVLKERGLLARKGAANTFDADGFVSLVRQIRENTKEVSIPGFDRARDCVVPGQGSLALDVQIVLIEGNYLLLEDAPWNELLPLFDMTVFINPGIEVLRQRLIQRWLDHGLSLEKALARAEENDIENAHHILANSVEADFTIS